MYYGGLALRAQTFAFNFSRELLKLYGNVVLVTNIRAIRAVTKEVRAASFSLNVVTLLHFQVK